MKKLILKKISSLVSIIFLIAISVSFLYAGKDDITGGILDKNVNSDDEDYGAFLIYGQTTDTLFFTSSRAVKNRRPIAISAEIFYSTRSSDYRKMNKPLNEGWSAAQQIVADASKIAQFTRGSQAVSSDRIIFAAERDLSTSTAQGTSYLFDLWQMTKRTDGFSTPEPLSTVNDIDAWDSQPAISQDGKILYFTSNRTGGKGGLDIWYSIMDASGSWSKAQLVPNINTPGDEVSPQCGADGKFYYSTNWDYTNNKIGNTGKDIYRADYQGAAGLSVPVNPVILDEAIGKDAEKYELKIPGSIQYNSDKDDEFPFITPDRQGIFITSNRKADFNKRNIYAYNLPKSRIMLQVNVQEQIFDSKNNLLVPPQTKQGLPLSLIDESSGASIDITSGTPYEIDADKTYKVHFSKFVEEECYQNKIEGPNELKVKSSRPFGPDTLFFVNALISRKKVEIPPIILHSTDTLPYFITGYWYPITKDNITDYRKREASGFFDETGFVDSTGHNYDMISQKIEEVFNDNIYKPLEKLLPSFQDFCQDTLFLKVTVHGYTDPRGLSGGNDHPYRTSSKFKRLYKDETVTVGIDEKGNPVTISTGIDMYKKSWPIDPNNKNGKWVTLPNEGEDGNVLLSKLRSYFTFVTFDKIMRQRSPIYSQMRDNGRVILDAEGFGIDKQGFKERNLRDDPTSRRIEIYIDVLRPEELKYFKRLPGGQLPEVKIAVQPNNAKEIKLPDETLPSTIPKLKPIQQFNQDVKPNQPVKLPTQPDSPQNDNHEPKTIDASKTVTVEADIKPLPPPEDKPRNDNQSQYEKKCYSIQYNSYETKEDADAGLKILNDNFIADSKVIEYLDPFGYRSYRLRSGCYETPEEAISKINSLESVAKALNLKRKPVVVR